ncbi:MAG: hypothetical protein HC934_08430 [Acaryochloridaceae cyanobacterium SU_2_1]|nr:hypothetical protein [Acaryochloridaceae cyanobacterium SU_2_1]
MSAIAGIFHRDHCPLQPQQLEEMIQALAHRGPQGCHSWLQGSIGLGHCLLWTTPESIHETLPLQQETLVITADVRLDNRPDLIDQLDLQDPDLSQLTDSQLILAAYQRWGKSCPAYLLGDFAFALWDGKQQQLFCARDHFGVKPFFLSCHRGAVCFCHGNQSPVNSARGSQSLKPSESWRLSHLNAL